MGIEGSIGPSTKKLLEDAVRLIQTTRFIDDWNAGDESVSENCLHCTLRPTDLPQVNEPSDRKRLSERLKTAAAFLREYDLPSTHSAENAAVSFRNCLRCA